MGLVLVSGAVAHAPRRSRLGVWPSYPLRGPTTKIVWARSVTLQRDNVMVPCPRCAAQFSDAQKLAVHNFRVHNVVSPVRRMVDTTHCSVGMLEFWSRTRLIEHMRKSRVCMLRLSLRDFRLTEEEATACDEEARKGDREAIRSGLRRGVALRACAQLAGPRWPVVPQVGTDGRRRGQRRLGV